MKPSIPRGTRDFGPAEMSKRQHIMGIIRHNFELFGFQPIETPAMENITTLTGKYGEEGDQLIFKILNSRIHESKNKDILKKEFDLSLESPRNSEELTERALRYDLTVPFARYVVMHQNELTFPFKRYQLQPVWRADKPQKGRYREFYQCDADVIGSNSLVNELELMCMMDKIFAELKIPVVLKINNRKILAGIAETVNEKDKITDITVAIDKVEKIGVDGVNQELLSKGVSEAAISSLQVLFVNESDTAGTLKLLQTFLSGSETGKKGIAEVEHLLNNIQQLNLSAGTSVELDVTLARGLNYYTGTIFEVKAQQGSLSSSILGGGRYDDLTGIFGLKDMSGVGISFGIDRIYDVMEELSLFGGAAISTGAKLLFLNTQPGIETECLKQATQLRAMNISCVVYPDATKKMSRQFEYAEKNKIPFVCKLSNEPGCLFELKKIGTEAWEKLPSVTELSKHLNQLQ